MLDRLRIILVRPIRSGNVGAAARAMRNMGLSDLVLVAPECDIRDEQAQGFAARAKDLLDSARIVDSVPTALEGSIASFATSAKGGFYRRQAAVTPAQAADSALQGASKGTVAIAFGPEDRGLVQRELLLFDRILEIPGNPDYPVLNLAAAVAVVCYELRQVWLRMQGSPLLPPKVEDSPAPDERKRIMYDKLFAALERIGFFDGQQSPDHLKYALRRIFGRNELTINEVDILIGMSQQMQWFADRGGRAAARKSDNATHTPSAGRRP
jgi:TrmH family RNA methyltransferase